ncbi:hypothetical protein F2Y14_12775 [Anaerostipes hadrus]|uniref:hypothetical protein n=1 Tax=Anaerostipes hadrus TaxID=649756 RepID=UPI00122F03F9|nr:hypothetical protein [Anaerostipes hadrus]KAA2369356.1 hypothetical protein F2Y14_12775 [Anaerostipes hadrus]
MWENTVITKAGIELLKNALSGGTITVTAIKSGAGKVDVSALKSQTAVSSIKQSGTVQGVTKTNETIKIGVLFSNAGLSAGYSMTQLGIYAKGSTGSEVLFAISQSTTGKEVPAESAMPSWSLVHNFYIKLNNDVKMTATVDPEGYVTFETMQTALNTHTGNKSNPHSVTKSQVGLGNVPNVATNDQTPTYSDTTTLVTLSSGEKISIAFAKIKLAITTLINHLANKSNPHGVTKSQVGLGNVENKSSATIRGELTKGNVTTALGFTPANQTDMTNAQDAITQLNSDYDTIIVGTSVTTTSQVINHYNNRKLSDYKFIVFAFGASDDDIRSIVTVPRTIFEKIGKSYNFVAHGSDDSTISIVSFTYASDTSMAVKLSADHGVKYIRVFGLK